VIPFCECTTCRWEQAQVGFTPTAPEKSYPTSPENRFDEALIEEFGDLDEGEEDAQAVRQEAERNAR
jgi:hypothetical protein